MNKCSKCGTEFEGNFCPECGTKYETKKICPECGAEQKVNVKFCTNCGYSFAETAVPTPTSDTQAETVSSQPTIDRPSSDTAEDIARVTEQTHVFYGNAPMHFDWHKWLKYLPVVFFGLWAVLLWAFYSAQLLDGDFFGLLEGNVYQLLNDDMYEEMHGALKALIAIASIADVVAIILAFIQIKSNKKIKLVGNAFCFALYLTVFIVVLVLNGKVKEQDIDTGAMVGLTVAFTVVFALLHGIALFAERHFCKNDEPERSVPKTREKRQWTTPAFIVKGKGWVVAHKTISVFIALVIVVAIVLAVVLPVTLCNIFRINKVSQIEFGYSYRQVKNILGEPNSSTSNEYVYNYYSSNAERVLKKLEKINQKAESVTDFDEIAKLSEQADKLLEELSEMDYKQIAVTFNSFGVTSVTMSLHSTQEFDASDIEKAEPTQQFQEQFTDGMAICVKITFADGNYRMENITDYESSTLYYSGIINRIFEEDNLSLLYYNDNGRHYTKEEIVERAVAVGKNIKSYVGTESSTRTSYNFNVYYESQRDVVESYFAEQRAERNSMLARTYVPIALLLCGMEVLALIYGKKLPSKKYILPFVIFGVVLTGVDIYFLNASLLLYFYTNDALITCFMVTQTIFWIVLSLLLLTTPIVGRVLAGKIHRKNLLAELPTATVSKYGLQMSKSFIVYVCTLFPLFIFINWLQRWQDWLQTPVQETCAMFVFLGSILSLISLATVSENADNGKTIIQYFCNLLSASAFIYILFGGINSNVRDREGYIATFSLAGIFAIVFIVLTSIALHRNSKKYKEEQDAETKKFFKRHIVGESVFLSFTVIGLVLGLLMWIIVEEYGIKKGYVIADILNYIRPLLIWGIIVYAVVSLLVILIKKYAHNRAQKTKTICVASLFSVGVVAVIVSTFLQVAYNILLYNYLWNIDGWQRPEFVTSLVASTYVIAPLRQLVFFGLIVALIEVLVTFIIKCAKKENADKAYTIETATDDLLLTFLLYLICFFAPYMFDMRSFM